MTNLRRVLLASAAVAAAVPALPAAPASADPIIECSPSFLIGPARCAIAKAESDLREDPPVVQCGLGFVIGPLQCKVEDAIRNLPDPT